MEVNDYILKIKNDEVPWRLFTPENANQNYCVLWIQGWTSPMDSHREGVERMAKKSGTAFATLDPAGHGLHKFPLEDSTRKQQLEEVVAVFDELKKRGYDKIIVIGGSFGGYLAALLLAERPVHTVMLRVPANYPDDEFETPYKETLRSKDYEAYTATKEHDEMLLNSAATRAVGAFKGFVYILEHELDEVVPAKGPRHYFKAAKKGNYLIIPATKHSPKLMANPAVHYAYVEHIVVSIIEAIKLQQRLEQK